MSLEYTLRQTLGEEVVTRGQAYVGDGAVFDVNWEAEDGVMHVTGTVEGSDLYQVAASLNLESGELLVSSCSKSSDEDGQCTHVAALLLAAETLGAFAKTKDRRAAIAQTIRKAALDRNVELSEEDVTNLSRRMLEINQRKPSLDPHITPQPTPFAKPAKIPIRTHGLDEFRVRAHYERATDSLTFDVVARYGPMNFPLLDRVRPNSQVFDVDGREIRHIAERADAEEFELASLLQHYATHDSEHPEHWTVRSEQLYAAIKQLLPDLEFRVNLELDETIAPLLREETAELDSTWSAERPTGHDWFDFSVAWHCNNLDLSTEDIEQFITEGKSYLRGKDGSFIEIQNREHIAELLTFIQESADTHGKGFRAKSFFAPELLHLLAEHQGSRLKQTDEAFRKLLDEARDGKPIEPLSFPAHLDSILRGYQKDGVAWMKFLRSHSFGGILADDMGLGKTAQVLAALSIMKDGGTVGLQDGSPSLVICPKTLLLTWKAEAEKFTPELRTVVIDGTPAERARIIENLQDYDLAITSYSLLQRDLNAYVHAETRFSYVVLDEAQAVKNAATATAQAVKILPSHWRLALTGTPLENGVHELWSIFDFLMPGFLGSRKAFTSRYERPITERQDVKTLERLRNKVKPFVLRRTKATHLADLPPKIEQTRPCELSPEQLIVYGRTLDDIRARVFRAVEINGFQRSRIEILSALMKLRRICDHPALEDSQLPRTEDISGKMAHCMELVREAIAGNHKVLLFSQFTSMLDILREALYAENIQTCTIEGKTRDRHGEVKRFQEDPNASVFLLSLKAGGTGLTLTAADTVILYDPWWNPQVEKQAMDRAHRIGQSKTVNVYKLVTQNTVEEKVVALQSKKQQIFDAIMQENSEAISTLTWDDLRGLFE